MPYQLTAVNSWKDAVKEAYEDSNRTDVYWHYKLEREEIQVSALRDELREINAQIDCIRDSITLPANLDDEARSIVEQELYSRRERLAGLRQRKQEINALLGKMGA